ncbi:aldose 1-epimerase [Poseidonocella pacifica]|uniref:Aldose 1-epimerase n=1 Tax=Poseidonocella pacifica TaxID=871651 RepID=A0A1I0XV29_9RHOB|nr:aldose epimerase family protein [Poseidonocella pacifica]SFB04915.1 aldose 1-epimerase [Poseidonocella pacifica]
MMRFVGVAPRGEDVHAVTLRSDDLSAEIWTLGATLADLRLEGVDSPLLLAPAAPSEMVGPLQYAGAVVGPVANRLRDGSLWIDGERYKLPPNEPTGHVVHCGEAGVHHSIWKIVHAGPTDAVLTLDLSAGEDGLPGTRRLEAHYQISGATLELTLTGKSDVQTVMNLAHHPYWNLGSNGDTADHELQIFADHVLETDKDLIPMGLPQPVEDTKFDFRTAHALDGDVEIDNSYCLATASRPMALAARLAGPLAKLTLETTEPGLQVFNGYSLPITGPRVLNDFEFGPRSGVALEPQGWPDAPNHPDYPSITLCPEEVYCQRTRYHLQIA